MFPLRAETPFAAALWTTALFAGATVAAVVAVTAAGALPALSAVGILPFASDASWHPTAGQFNLLPMLVGTLTVSLGALLLAGPVGIISAIFCNYYARGWPAASYRLLLRALAGVPSVVFGLWGLVVLVPLIAAVRPPGARLLAGTMVLALMILPTVAVVAESAIAQVSPTLFRGGCALGIPRHKAIVKVVLPAARSGLSAALVLALGRALGETMAVLMVTGNVVQVPGSLFDPVRTLAANIALEMAYAMDVHRSALFVSGLVLTFLVGVVLVAAERLSQSEGHHVD
ncbi:MAG TPA: phosphate ABC transporter permease subunit PstC [Arenibaculum sp.]|nr:phosphate ABC transporter permease subunit PstC [Arenibaculum sp.]